MKEHMNTHTVVREKGEGAGERFLTLGRKTYMKVQLSDSSHPKSHPRHAHQALLNLPTMETPFSSPTDTGQPFAAIRWCHCQEPNRPHCASAALGSSTALLAGTRYKDGLLAAY